MTPRLNDKIENAMRFSALTERITGPGNDAWTIHRQACEAFNRGEDVIVMSIGDPDFSTPKVIVERAVEALYGGDTHYAEIPGRPALNRAIAGLYRQQGLDVDERWVIPAAGAQNALYAAVQCLLDPGDEVLAFAPLYVTYTATLEAHGAKLVKINTSAEHSFRPDVAALADAITPQTRAIFLATPNNPTGVVLNRQELSAIAELARAHDLWVLVDEVYQHLVYDGSFVSMASLPGMLERTVSLGSLSKSHAMTGWRAGWIMGPPEMIEHAQRLALNMLYGLPGFVQEAAITAIAHHQSICEEARQVYAARCEVVRQGLENHPRLTLLTPKAGMFVLLDIRQTGLSSHDFAWRLFREAGVSVLDAAAFGEIASGFVRISFTLNEAALAEGCRRLCKFVDSLN
ncbi:pyridoxal phosphate-dependent aminotransferase [Pokkaliibacter sp. CJK22405]|uniref:pyridoxal phosphate-dependent aminotransferase n=1 Tax=Pokkaliibacter sp. CJK22405 TaxID=3384615 RepID=UPI0039855C09